MLQMMRSKLLPRKLNQCSTVDDYEFGGAFKQYPNNLASPDSTNTLLRLTTNTNNDINSYHHNTHHQQQQQQQQQQHHHHSRLNGYSQSNSPNRSLGGLIDSTTFTNTLAHPPAHMEHLFSSKLQAERLLLELTSFQESICDLKPNENGIASGGSAASGVIAKQHLRRGTRFGPFAMTETTEKSNAWDILPISHIRSLLEPSPEVKLLLKKIRISNNLEGEKEANFNNFYVAGCLWYESNRDIEAGEEIIIDGRPKTLYDQHDLLANGEMHNGSSIHSSDDRSERDNASFYGSNLNREEDYKNKDKSSDQIKSELSDDENGFDIRCEVCDKVFTELEGLDDHLVGAHHFRKDEFFCELCSQRFCHRPLLLKHRALQHNEIRKYPCENCTKVFCDPSNLQRHIRNHHIGARSHACPECGKTFATSSGLKQHTHIHSSVKPFQCEVCFKAYTQFSNLCRHRRMHADCRMQIKCSKCGQSFSTVTSLSKHKRFCDSTNVPPAGVGLPPSLQHSLHHQAQPQTPAQSRSAATVNGALSNNMTTPPNPFLFWRSTFFPAFPPAAAAFGLQGMFPQAPAATQTSNFSPMFSKPTVDFKLQQIRTQPPVNTLNHNNNHKVNTLPLNSPKEDLPVTANQEAFGLYFNKFELEQQKVKLEMEQKVKRERNSADSYQRNNKRNDTQRYNSDDESLETKERTIKHETKKDTELKLKKEEDEEAGLKINDDDKKSIDIVSVSPHHEAEAKSSYTELPLDLSVSRKRSSIDSNFSQQSSEQKSTRDNEHNSSLNIREISPIAHEELSNTDSYEQVAKKPRIFNSSVNSSRTPTASPGPTPSPSPPCNVSSTAGTHENNSASSLPTCPRPLHPMLLDEIYRTHALESTFPRPFPFLGLMGERSSLEANALRAREEQFVAEPMFHEALRGLSAGALQVAQSGKLKDRYTCKFCGKVFPRSANLTRHLRTHTGEQPYTCKYCDRAFSISSNLQRHVRNIHNKERPFRCHLCDRCFGQQTNLDRHLKKHESDTTGLGLAISDSPSSNEADREDSYFDEIRNFMDRVTYNEDLYTPSSIGNAENDTDYNNSDNELSVSRPSSADLTNEQHKVSEANEILEDD
ncbi:transcription factor hamlet isoform X1 [Lucilia cuprina]|uniref:transcription factor hamlet isoform X1 n=1 Tax=Lucilia cuprina TaxID=7375 RepID=UPI001F067080|nr:transcription factor hamlet isoform X1 [Lucilia cuprina]XP_046812335.1 transcription factor hamlet isoform X1 [Lucilia cuprina]XP_046812336.1 transcription factor hamlet isoform X1 [Lucilia cuprina]